MTTARKPASGPESSRGRLLRIGSVVGVPIFVTPSWVLVTVFITISYSDLMRGQVPGASKADAYLLSLSYALGLAASVLIHEIGHTVVSRALGIPVRRIVVFLLGGLSELTAEPVRPRDEFGIAAAGPAMSFALAGACWGADVVLPANSAPAVLTAMLAWSNLIIAVFNVLPGLPLDGGRLVQALVWKLGSSRIRGIRVAAWSGRGLAVLVAGSVLVATSLSADTSTTRLAGIGATAVGFAVAAFIWFGAGQTLGQAEIIVRARALELSALLRPAVYLPAHTPVAEAVRQVHQSGARAIVVTDNNGRSRAIVAEEAVRRIPPDQRPWTSVGAIAHAIDLRAIVSDNLNGEALLEAISVQPTSEYLVVGADGVSRGVLAAADVARSLNHRHRGAS